MKIFTIFCLVGLYRKVLNLSLTCTPSGVRCLNIYVPVEEQGTLWAHFGGQVLKLTAARLDELWEMSKQTCQLLFSLYWIIYQVTNYEKWVYWRRDSKIPHIGREGGVALVDFPKIEGLIGSLIGQRVKHFGIAFAIDLRKPEKRPLSESDTGLRSVSIKIIPPSLASAEFLYYQTTCRHL